MPDKDTGQRSANRLYHSAKISEDQFKTVLRSFARDDAVAVAAAHAKLSQNSIHAIYQKLRIYFTELGLFVDIYEGQDPSNGVQWAKHLLPEDNQEEFEAHILAYHQSRIREKRRLKLGLANEDYNFYESYWRFQYLVMTEGRESGNIHEMMYNHLLAHIRQSGPVGKPVRKSLASLQLMNEQLDQRMRWLLRNSPFTSSEASRRELNDILAIPMPKFRRRRKF